MWIFAVLAINDEYADKFVPFAPTTVQEQIVQQCWELLFDLYPDSYQADNLYPYPR